ncbi:hypothetical protein LDENG_00250210 [Lucifuga dentata]|nr:hypothetical protein LDENG_00250210 [Lucifuga dentata]
MASSETPPPSLCQGVWIVLLDSGVTVEVLLAVGQQIGHDKLPYASRMNKAVVVFLKEEKHTLELSFTVKHGNSSCMVYASSERMKCFECGDVGHKRFAFRIDSRRPTPPMMRGLTMRMSKRRGQRGPNDGPAAAGWGAASAGVAACAGAQSVGASQR